MPLSYGESFRGQTNGNCIAAACVSVMKHEIYNIKQKCCFLFVNRASVLCATLTATFCSPYMSIFQELSSASSRAAAWWRAAHL